MQAKIKSASQRFLDNIEMLTGGHRVGTKAVLIPAMIAPEQLAILRTSIDHLPKQKENFR